MDDSTAVSAPTAWNTSGVHTRIYIAMPCVYAMYVRRMYVIDSGVEHAYQGFP